MRQPAPACPRIACMCGRGPAACTCRPAWCAAAIHLPFPGALTGQVFKFVEAKKTMTWRFYCTKILPVGLFMALTLHFGNLVYLYLTVAFIQMLKVCVWVCGWVGGGRGLGLVDG